MAGEFSAIERIARLLPGPPPAGETWIGDDAAVLSSADGWLLLATDLIVAGVDFPTDGDLADAGWKALVINVSDIAAMGGRPGHALVGVAGPPETDLDRLYSGLAEAATAYTCPIVGGDLSNADQLVVSVAVTGTVAAGGAGPVLRSGARPGDAVFVTGPLGAAAASGYSRRPAARLEAGETARLAGATAMIDVSDGLAADLGHILDASGVGAVLDHVPVAVGATEEQALSGGEDYELIITGPADLSVGIRIGTCTDDPLQRPPAAGGWQHHFR